MIKKLRIKLIVASMISLFLVLFIIGGIAGVLNYRKIAEDADRILEVLEKNAGHFPKMIPGNEKGAKTVVAMLGEYGSLAYENGKFYKLDAEKVEVVNTVGAGDSYIAAFTYGVSLGEDIMQCMQWESKEKKVCLTSNTH